MVKKITALRTGRGKGKRVNIFLDGIFAFSLEAEVVSKEGLRVEQTLSEEQIEALAKSAQCQLGLKTAFRYLSYRPRSEFELREKLHRRGFNAETEEMVIARLKKQGLVDDVAFARLWSDSRESLSPRSQWLAGLELKKKGIADDIIAQATTVIDDDESAYRAALSKARRLPHAEYEDFRRKLGGYLRRRGFDYEITGQTVKRVWEELKVEV